MLIGLENDSVCVHVPLPIGAMMHDVDPQVVKQITDWNVSVMKPDKTIGKEYIGEKDCRWFAQNE